MDSPHDAHVAERVPAPAWAATSVRALLVEPTVPILLIAAAVQVVRQAWVDFAVFAGGAVVIRWDARRPSRAVAPAGRRRMPLPLAVGVLAFGVLIAALPRGSVAESAALGVPGLVAAGALLRRRPRDPLPEPSAAGLPGRFTWLVLGLALAVIELGSFLSESTPGVANPEHPTVSDLLEPFLESPVSRGLAALAWVAAGIWLVRRARTAGRAP